MSERLTRGLVALLGRRDFPTDGVYDYCEQLGRAMARAGVRVRTAPVPWDEVGWPNALARLRTEMTDWRGQWVVIQYTALGWSRRGVAVRVLQVLNELRRGRLRSAIVFHDVQGFGGNGPVAKLRRRFQHLVMRAAYRLADRSVLTVPADRVPWLRPGSNKVVFIPVGSNVCNPPDGRPDVARRTPESSVVAVFGVTGGDQIHREVSDIADVVRRAKRRVHQLHLIVVGRGSEGAKEAFSRALSAEDVNVSVLGVRPGYEVARLLCGADALLFVRGHVSTRRSSAIAGISCGVPVVGYRGKETASNLTDAGFVLVEEGDRQALADALGRILADREYRLALREKTVRAARDVFSWEAIGRRFCEVLADE